MMDAHPAPRPDPRSAADSQEFLDALKALRAWAGQPSLRTMTRLAGKVTVPGRPAIDVLPVSTLSDNLAGKRLPNLPRESFVDAFVRACLHANGHDEDQASAELERWLDARQRLATGQVRRPVRRRRAVTDRRSPRSSATSGRAARRLTAAAHRLSRRRGGRPPVRRPGGGRVRRLTVLGLAAIIALFLVTASLPASVGQTRRSPGTARAEAPPAGGGSSAAPVTPTPPVNGSGAKRPGSVGGVSGQGGSGTAPAPAAGGQTSGGQAADGQAASDQASGGTATGGQAAGGQSGSGTPQSPASAPGGNAYDPQRQATQYNNAIQSQQQQYAQYLNGFQR